MLVGIVLGYTFRYSRKEQQFGPGKLAYFSKSSELPWAERESNPHAGVTRKRF